LNGLRSREIMGWWVQVDLNLASGFVVKMPTLERANNNNERSKEASFADKVAAKRRRVMSGRGSKKREHNCSGRRVEEKKSRVSMRMLTARQEARQMRRPIRA
jgi:hypothetical protein